jgi:hypothetical protein
MSTFVPGVAPACNLRAATKKNEPFDANVSTAIGNIG